MKNAAELIEEIKKTESLCRTPHLKSVLAHFLTIAEGLAELEKALTTLQKEPPGIAPQ